jgi:hypothetical protein
MSFTVQSLGRLPNGTFQTLGVSVKLPDGTTTRAGLKRKLGSSVVVDTAVSISGTVAPGQTVTRSAGVYSGATLFVVRYEWVQKNDATILYRAEGTSYAIPADSPTGSLTLTEVLRDEFGVIYEYSTSPATITGGTVAPAFTVQPTLAGSGEVGSVLTLSNGTVTGSPTPTLARQWRRGTTQFTNTAATYTPVSGDVGLSISGRIVATNTAGVTNSNWTSGIVITGGTSGTTYNVDTQAELDTAIANSVAGDLILVAAGTYASMNINGRVKAGGRVTIRAADAANPPRISGSINATGAQGWIIDNFAVGPAVDPPAAQRTGNGVTYSNARRVTFRNLLVENRFTNMVSDGGCEDIVIEACEVRKYQMDGIRLYNRASRVTIRNCRVYQCVPNTGANDHRDCFQVATLENNAWVEDLLVENNHFTGVGNVLHQGILVRNGWILGSGPNPPNDPPPTASFNAWIDDPDNERPTQGHRRFTIRNNLIEVRAGNGICSSCTRDLLVERNVLRRIPGTYGGNDSQDGNKPRLRVAGPCTGRIVNNVSEGGNIFFQPEFHQPSGTSFTGTLGMFESTAGNTFNNATAFPTGWVTPVAGRYALD